MPQSAKELKRVSQAKEITRRPVYIRELKDLYGLAIWHSATGLRREILIEGEYTCVACGKLGNHVDHIEPHMNDMWRFCDKDNLQVLCASCHSSKTNAERVGRHIEWQADRVRRG